MHGLPKTGDQLLKVVKEEKEVMEHKYNVEMVGWCTDDGPDGKKMRRLAALIWPQLVLIFCWAHQIELICKAISKSSRLYEDTFISASNVVKHVNNHDIILQQVRQETERANDGKSWALTLPGATRWCSRYLTVSRLLRVRLSLRTVYFRENEWMLEHIGQQETQAHTQDVISTVLSDVFWDRVKV
jgi:hypothetical protein